MSLKMLRFFFWIAQTGLQVQGLDKIFSDQEDYEKTNQEYIRFFNTDNINSENINEFQNSDSEEFQNENLMISEKSDKISEKLIHPEKHLSFYDYQSTHILQLNLDKFSPRSLRKVLEIAHKKGATSQLLRKKTPNQKTQKISYIHNNEDFINRLRDEEERIYPRILSLDGGGMRGILALSVLHQLEQWSGKKLNELFDVVIGVSTGAIIAGGIAQGLTALEILDFYEKMGPIAFSKKIKLSINGLFGPKYDVEPYVTILKNHFKAPFEKQVSHIQDTIHAWMDKEKELFDPFKREFFEESESINLEFLTKKINSYANNLIKKNSSEAVDAFIEHTHKAWEIFLEKKGKRGEINHFNPLAVYKSHFNEMKLKDCKTHCFFVVYNQTQARGEVISSKDPLFEEESMSKIVQASSAAQTYFPPVSIKKENNSFEKRLDSLKVTMEEWRKNAFGLFDAFMKEQEILITSQSAISIEFLKQQVESYKNKKDIMNEDSLSNKDKVEHFLQALNNSWKGFCEKQKDSLKGRLFNPLDFYKMEKGEKEEAYVDGGIYKNNPAELGVLFASKYYHVDVSESIVLSVGTGITKTKHSVKETNNLGLFGWARVIINKNFDGESTDDIMKELMDERHYCRIQFDLPSEHYQTERIDNFSALKKIAEEEILKKKDSLEKFLEILKSPKKRN